MQALDEARQLLARASRVCVLTGAGMSAESGIPTFRDALTGLWARFDPAQLASADGFRANPQRVWDWYAERREGVRDAEPNAGHRALALFDQHRPGVLTVVTQNVDDLHQRAGTDRHDPPARRHPAGPLVRGLQARPELRPSAVRWRGAHRTVRDCGNRVRPGVVWFGEPLPRAAFRAAERAAERCQVMLVVGTSGAVWPAAGLATLARTAGAKVVILNPQASEIDAEAHLVLRGTAAETLPPLLQAWSLH